MTNTVQTVPLGDLAHDPMIMQMPGQAERLKNLDDLIASIPVHGLLQSLKVRFNSTTLQYLVTAGNRRYAALKQLLADGATIQGIDLTDDYPVPVVVGAESDDEAREQSVAENIQRLAPTPAAEARQFAEMAKTSHPKEIAAHFGVPERRVQQRLKLASLHPDLLAALEAETITLAAAEAFSVEDDPAKQLKYFNKAEGNSWKLTPAEIKKALTKKLVEGTAPITRVVGREVYTAAGGVIVTDPFSGAEYWTDGRLLEELAAKHWAQQVAAWEAEGWAFVVEARATYGQYFYPHHKVTPAEVPLDEETAAERSRLMARLAAIVHDFNVDPYDFEDDAVDVDELLKGVQDEEPPGPTPEIEAECATIEARLIEIANAGKAFSAEQKVGSGIVYWLDGSQAPVFGFIDEKRATPPPEEAKKRPREPKPSLTEGLKWDLQDMLRKALFASLRERAAVDPLFGLQILVAKLHVSAVHGGGHDVPLALNVPHGFRIAGQPERGKSFGGALNWAKQQDVATLAEAAGALVGQLVSPAGYGGGEEPTAALIRLLKPNTSAHFDVEAYCKALTAPQLGLVWRELMDGAKAPEPKELLKQVVKGIRDKGWLPPQLRTSDYKGPAGKAKGKKKGAADHDEDEVPAVAAE